jgi:hypothetical protein
MITLTREEAQQVLDALDEYRDSTEDFRVANRCISLIKTLRARLAQPEPKQDDGVCGNCNGAGCKFCDARYLIAEPVMLMDAPLLLNGQPLYTTPPQREWQGLTDDERTYLAWESNNGPHCVAMTEAKLKEKNT